MFKGGFRVPTRIPQLYYGASAVPRSTTGRAKLAEALYLFLFILSYILFAVAGLLGYLFRQAYGLAIFGLLGYGAGVWIRRSLGLRGRKRTTGFFMRMRERAQGARPGLLEWLLEKVSGREVTQAKCKAVVLAYEKSVKGLKGAKTTEEQNKILAELDRRVQQILS
jgi:hypothetical protein